MAGLSLSSGLTLGLSSHGGGVAVPTAGASRVSDWVEAVGLTPALYYHPNTETVTQSGGRLTAVSANSLSPALTPSATGPKVVTYANGIKVWRSDGSEFLDVPNTFAANARQITIFMVSRIHEQTAVNNFFTISYNSDGVTPLAGSGTFRSASAGTPAAYLHNVTISSAGTTGNKEFMVPAAQTQVIGLASRTTANGGSKFWVNTKASDTLSQNFVATTGTVGARIFGNVASNGTQNCMDLLEMVVFTGELTNTQAQTIADYLTSRWAIAEITKQMIFEGDSITDGVVEVVSGDNVAMVLTEPGISLVEPNVRVYNMAKSGAKVSDLITRRDVANGWPTMKIGANAADNILAVQIGRNDTAAYVTGGDSAAVAASKVYADILTYHNTAVTGTVARGWRVVQFGNIACDPGVTGTNLRDLILANFATDVSSGSVIDLQQIVDSAGGAGRKPFAQVPDTRDGVYYQDDDGSLDTTHPSTYGTRIMATGGDTPQYGYIAAF